LTGFHKWRRIVRPQAIRRHTLLRFTSKTGRDRLGVSVVLITLVLVAVLVFTQPVNDWISAAAEWQDGHPVGGALLFIAASTIAAVLFVPGSVIFMLAGFVFDFMTGSLIGLAAISAGAYAAFLCGRLLVRDWAEAQIRRRPRLLALDRAVDTQAFLLVALTRASLIIPYNVLNYVFGATAVKRLPYFLGTVVGMIPATLLYVYLGTLARDYDDVRSGRLGDDLPSGWLLAFGLVVLAAAVYLVQRAAARTLRERLER
jgi:uncharacterized membrane protein YdjX (TVP38/TMEM64 family)